MVGPHRATPAREPSGRECGQHVPRERRQESRESADRSRLSTSKSRPDKSRPDNIRPSNIRPSNIRQSADKRSAVMPSRTGTAPPPERAGPRQWTGLAVLVLPTFLLTIDITVLFLAVPHLSADLDASANQQLWILDIYGFMIAGLLITMGTLGDRVGRRRLLVIGAVAFSVVSVAAAFSTSPEMLVVTRALLGVAGATVMPSTLSLIRNLFHDERQRRVAVSLWSAGLMGGVALGPAVGGLMLDAFWWGSVFLLAVPVMALVLVTAPFVLPEFRDPAPGRIDGVSVVLSLVAILPLVYGLKDAAKNGLQGATPFVLAAGLLAGWLFVRRQRRLEAPLLDLGLFRHRAFSVGLTALLLVSMIMGAFGLLFAQYLQLVRDMPPTQAGLWSVPNSLAGIAGLLLTPPLAARWGTGRTLCLGLAVATAGFLLYARTSADSSMVLPLIAVIVISVGMSPMIVLVTTLVIGTAPKERSGSASSISESSQEIGVSLGIAAFGSLSALVYRNGTDGALPGGVTGRAAEAAGDSIAGAASAAESLPRAVASELMHVAREAFMDGMSTFAYVSAALTAGLAVVAALFLRDGASQKHAVHQDGQQEPLTAP